MALRRWKTYRTPTGQMRSKLIPQESNVRIKIEGGTPKTGKSLCLTCKHAEIVRGQNMEELVVCNNGPFDTTGSGGIVRFKVAECGKYHVLTHPWLYEMEEIAWKIEARKRGATGFGDGAITDPNAMEVVVTPPTKDDK